MRGFVSILLFLGAGSGLAPAASEDAHLQFFEAKIRPLLVQKCYTCHSADTKPSGDLRVDDRNGLLTGGTSGPAIIPGHPGKSLLLQRVVHTDPKKVMPKEGDLLTDSQLADLTLWIQQGAAWPAEEVPASLTQSPPEFEALKGQHWAWQPLQSPAVPAVQNSDWTESDIDRFLLARLEAEGLSPVGDADRAMLLRRVTFDLTGLPPTPDELADFLADASPDAFARVVDRLLNSSDFGVQWGRHWLDVARYGESTGPSRNIPYPHAWKYRDYVIDAVNRDVPFNRFIQEQIAGDLLLPAASLEERDQMLTATGFLALGVKDVNQRFKVRFIMDNVDEQIDAVTRSVLALTVSCARCHDHKFDPIPAADYYALAGIFTSTENGAGVRNKMGGGGLDYYDPANLIRLASAPPPPPAEEVSALEARVAEAKTAYEAIRGTPEGLQPGTSGNQVQREYRTRYENLRADLMKLTDPAQRGGAVHGVREGPVIGDTEIRIRGEAERLGPRVARGYLSAVTVEGARPVNPSQSGRLELAQWLTSSRNPLTSRVIVNRVWQRLFGEGIVNTVDNFGVKGDRPSHPEMLDYLAQDFMRNGWSMKNLIRTLVLTHAYRLGPEAPASHLERDPANRLIWRHSPRRLTAEEVRDAILFTAGQMTPPPDVSPATLLSMVEMRDNGPEAARLHMAANAGLQRSVYLPLLRGVTPAALEAFDPVEQTLVTGQRDQTTVPSQALFLLNSTFVRRQALALAEELMDWPGTPRERIRRAYLVTAGREPTIQEEDRALEFVSGTFPVTGTREAGSVPPAEGSDGVVSEVVTPENPDNVDRTPSASSDSEPVPASSEEAAWMLFSQALYAAAEFRYLR